MLKKCSVLNNLKLKDQKRVNNFTFQRSVYISLPNNLIYNVDQG